MEKKIINYLIGSDFEMFAMHKQTKEIISAEGLIQGTKHEPFNFDPENKFFNTMLDNILLEVGIPPCNNKDAWVKAILKAKNYVDSILPDDVCSAPIAAARVKDKWLSSEQARTMGCESDYCVWTRSQNPKPDSALNLRSTGMHVHVGFEDKNIELIEALVKALDLHLSVPAVLIEPDSERKKLYGRAGCFRIPTHGVEYRTLSGYFAGTPELSAWVYDNTEAAIKFVNERDMEEIEAVREQIISAINDNDKVLAGNLVRQFDLNLI